MCGICGVVDFAGRPVRRSDVEPMVDTLRHRGPDGTGCYVNAFVGLGHTRLSIIDLDSGSQPMSTADGRLTVVFNGEIYNYVELRQELESDGRVFRTRSDTETILHAYDRWGVDCHHHLNGMWAFALWDAANRQLLLSRDRLGEKPLYYAMHDGRLLFGSEIKAILAAGMPVDPRPELLELVLTLGTVPAPDTYYRNIYKVRPGHYLLSRGTAAQQTRYWDLPVRAEHDLDRDARAVSRRFEMLFTDSVRLRMRSDVPFGAFLSGGLDSSSVVATMSALSSGAVNTFTAGFDERAFDERELAATVSRAFQTNHREIVVEQDSFERALRDTLHHFDEPFGDSSAIPTGAVAREARRHVKVVLTGDGGDEALSGYTAYQGARFAEQYQIVPRAVHNTMAGGLRVVGQLMSGDRRYRINRVQRVLAASVLDPDARLISKFTGGHLPVIDRLLTDVPERVRIADYMSDFLSACPYREEFYRRMYFDLKLLLPEDMLTKVDRMSMAHSLECRLPFLDHRVVELLAVTDRRVKMRGYQRKSVLRQTVGQRLPRPVLRAPKQGFGAPVREWFKSDALQTRLASLRHSGAGFERGAVRHVVEANARGEHDFGNLIWTLFVLDGWHRQSRRVPEPAVAS